jgi:hypothetical protein
MPVRRSNEIVSTQSAPVISANQTVPGSGKTTGEESLTLLVRILAGQAARAFFAEHQAGTLRQTNKRDGRSSVSGSQ